MGMRLVRGLKDDWTDVWDCQVVETKPVRGVQRPTRILSKRENLGMDQVFVVRTSKSGLNQPIVRSGLDHRRFVPLLVVLNRENLVHPYFFPGC